MYLGIDAGTTNLKVGLFDENFNIVKLFKKRVRCEYPEEGWVEQNAEEIWNSLNSIIREIDGKIDAVGIANQRETTVLWDRRTGKPIYNAIVWQCRRTANMMKELEKEYGEEIKKKTGLEMDSYFSASKIKWILDNVPHAREKAKMGELKFGTIDSFLLWKMSGEHKTDHTNASRTMLYNIEKGEWDDGLLEIFSIPLDILPKIEDSAGVFGETNIGGKNVQITGMIGDQQSSLLALGGIKEGDMKVTYGTGTFMLVNTGKKNHMEKGLLSTVAWGIDGERTYALEGSILSSGSVVEWLKGMGLWSEDVGDETSLYFVPAFAGLGSPYWDPYARGTILGITSYTKKENITRAALESIGYMVRDIAELMKKWVKIKKIMADGGMSNNDFLMQFQADILNVPVFVPDITEMTARGAAMLSAIGIGDMKVNDIQPPEEGKLFEPEMSEEKRKNKYEKWKDAIRRSMGWYGEP